MLNFLWVFGSCVCVFILFIYTISISIFFLSQEELSLAESSILRVSREEPSPSESNQ